MPALSRLVRVFTVTSTLALAGCAGAAMPTGYTYQGEVYKNMPGSEAPRPAYVVGHGRAPATATTIEPSVEVTMPDAAPIMQEQGLPPGFTSVDIDALTTLSEDLLGQLVRNFGSMTEPTRILSSAAATNRDAAMAIALRRAMERHAIPVATSEGYGPFTLGYDIRDRAAYDGRHVLDADIFLIVQGKEVTRQTGSVSINAAPVSMSGPVIIDSSY